MKIICSWCKKLLGEKEPFGDLSESRARCSECLEKQRKEEAEAKAKKLNPPKKSRIVKVREGLEGRLTIAGKESPKLALLEIDFSGRTFVCCEESKADFEKYIQSLPGNEVDVTWIHSGEFKLELPKRANSKKKNKRENETQPEGEDVFYNCTIRVPKPHVFGIFQSSMQKTNEITQIFAEAAYNMLTRQEAEKPNVQADT